MSLVIASCPADKMNRQSGEPYVQYHFTVTKFDLLVKVLVHFMCGKLEDTETIIPALKALTSLVTQPAFTSTDAVDVVKALVRSYKTELLADCPI